MKHGSRTLSSGASQGPDLFGTDSFIDALGQGHDPSDGADELAAMLLDLRDEVTAPMPAAPVLPEIVAAPAETSRISDTGAAARVTSFAEHRAKKRRRALPKRRAGGIGPAFIGAAAATLVIVGGGGAVYNASPDSALWPANVAIFGNHASVVELATTLEEADSRNANGDVEGALELLDKARSMAREINTRERAEAERRLAETEAKITETVTVTQTVTQPAPPPPAETVTVTETLEIPVLSTTPTTTTPVNPANPLDPANPNEPSGAAPTTEPAPVPIEIGADGGTQQPPAYGRLIGEETTSAVDAGQPTTTAVPLP